MNLAKCTKINILLNKDGHFLVLRKGIGLANIKKRSEIIGGIFTPESKINVGTMPEIKISVK